MARSRGKISPAALFSEVILSLEDPSTATALSLGKTDPDPIHCLGIADNRAVTFDYCDDQGPLMIFRLSQKLNSKIKAGTLQTLSLAENPFADWSAHLFGVERTQYILLTNTKSLYSFVLPGKGVTNVNLFIEQALSGIRDSLEADLMNSVYERVIAPDTETVHFAKALNRSVTGSMNELTFHAMLKLIGKEHPLREVSFGLNQELLSAIASSKSQGYGVPAKVFREMVKTVE